MPTYFKSFQSAKTFTDNAEDRYVVRFVPGKGYRVVNMGPKTTVAGVKA